MTEDKQESKRTRRCTLTYPQFMAVLGCFLSNLLTGGLPNSFGILYTYMQETMDVTEYQLSWMGSLNSGALGVMAVVSSLLIDIKGCRFTSLLGPFLAAAGLIGGSLSQSLWTLYLTVGIMSGTGLCLPYIASLVQVNRQFSKWRPVAIGITASGSAIGVLAFPLLTTLLADTFGWRGALLIYGAMVLNGLPFALAASTDTDEHRGSKENRFSIVKKCVQNFLGFFKIQGAVLSSVAHVAIGTGYYTFATFAPGYVVNKFQGMMIKDAALIITVTGCCNLIGRLFFPFCSMTHVKGPRCIFILNLALSGVTTALVPFVTNAQLLFVLGAFYGLAFGGWPSTGPTVLVELFGLKNVSKSIGTANCFIGVGSLVGPPLQSMMASSYGNRDIIFYTAGLCLVTSSVLMLIASLVIMRVKDKQITDITIYAIENGAFSKTDAAG